MSYIFSVVNMDPVPDKPGCYTLSGNKSREEVLNALSEYLKTIPYKDSTLYDYFDFLHPELFADKNKAIPEFHYIIAYWVPGSSEGYYFHIDSLFYDKVTRLITGKTLGGWDEALIMNNEINKFFAQSYF